MSDAIDHSVGVAILVRIGDSVELGQPLERGFLRGLERSFVRPLRPGRAKGALELGLLGLDAVPLEDGRVDIEPGRVGLGHGVAHIDEHDVGLQFGNGRNRVRCRSCLPGNFDPGDIFQQGYQSQAHDGVIIYQEHF